MSYETALDLERWAAGAESLLRELRHSRDFLTLLAVTEPRRSVAIERMAKACVLLNQALAVTEADQRRAREVLIADDGDGAA